MPRVLRSQSHRSQHRVASTAQVTTYTSRQTRGRGRGSRRTSGRGRVTADRGLQSTTTTIAPTTTIGRSRGRRTTRRDTTQPRLQPPRQDDGEPVGDLEHLQSVIRSEIQQALAAEFPQSNLQPTNVSGPSPSGDSHPLSATLPTGGTPAIPISQAGASSCSETGHGGCLHTNTYVSGPTEVGG